MFLQLLIMAFFWLSLMGWRPARLQRFIFRASSIVIRTGQSARDITSAPADKEVKLCVHLALNDIPLIMWPPDGYPDGGHITSTVHTSDWSESRSDFPARPAGEPNIAISCG